MLFVNATPLEATAVPNAEAGDDVAVLVVVAMTCKLLDHAPPAEALALADVQRPIVTGMHGEVPGDDVFVRTGASISATGFVHAPGGEAPRGEAKLTLEFPRRDGPPSRAEGPTSSARPSRLHDVERTVAAFGPRVWRRGLGMLAPTSPLPFTAIPMTWHNAFGGKFIRPAEIRSENGRDYYVPEHEAPYPYNAEGTGYYRDDRHAEEQPLPMLEDPAHLVTRWDDKPHPLCFAPYATRGALRVLSAVTVEGQVDFNRAGLLTHRATPQLTFAELPVGTIVRLSGMRERGQTLAFRVPEAPAFLEVTLGEKTTRLELAVDAAEIDAAAGEVRLVYRKIFRYPLIEGDLRMVRVEGTAHLTELVKNHTREA